MFLMYDVMQQNLFFIFIYSKDIFQNNLEFGIYTNANNSADKSD